MRWMSFNFNTESSIRLYKIFSRRNKKAIRIRAAWFLDDPGVIYICDIQTKQNIQ